MYERLRGNHRLKAIALCLVAFLIVLAIVVPIVIFLVKKNQTVVYVANIIVPLYIYPWAGAWDPLFQAIEKYNSLQFLVIVNPSNGPGNSTLPNIDFVAGIRKLNGYKSVRTIGYVETGWGARDAKDVVADITTYSGWATNYSDKSLELDGIFLNQSPSNYSMVNAQYLLHINQAIKSSSGFSSTNLVVHNPGMIPVANLENNLTDITIVFEGAYNDFQNASGALFSLPGNKTDYGYLVHALPSVSDTISIKSTVEVASHYADYLFFTRVAEAWYSHFDTQWMDFCAAVVQAKSSLS